MQITQSLSLNRPPQEKDLIFENIRQIGHHGLSHFIIGGAVEHQSKRAFRIVLANENHGAMEKRPAKLPVVQDQLPLQRFARLLHQPSKTACDRLAALAISFTFAACQNCLWY